MSQKIEYLRTKENKKDRIIYDEKSKSYKNRHVTISLGFDHILNKWVKISEKIELLPVESYPTHPEKTKIFFAIVMRNATDYATLKLLTRFFKRKIIVTMKDAESNVYLVLVNGILFQTDVLCHEWSMTAPLSINTIMNPKYRPQNIKVDIESEAQPISIEEKDALLHEGYPLFEEVFTKEDGSESEYRTIT